MSEPSLHPTPEDLSAYSLGQLSQERAVAIDSHISECQPCCETIVGLSSDDTFVGLLKEARQLPIAQTMDHDSQESQPSSFHAGIPPELAEHPRYEIVRLIGKGGMGDVYEANHRKMERRVALKVINRELFQKAEAVNRFHREVTTAAQLSHPNIVTSHDADQAGEHHFMVMEYVDGIDLSHIVKDRGALPIAEACDYVRQAAIGLQHAHERGMVHRDIKPHNLMVTADGTIKILDFGLASLSPEANPVSDALEVRTDLTAVGAIMGTPDFISPEQAKDARQVDIRSDIYSLGATFYYLLSGRVPFDDGSVMHKLKSHAQVEPAPLDSVRDDLPDALATIVSSMMAKDPDERYLTPREVADALESFLQTWQPDEDDTPRQGVSNGGGNGSGTGGHPALPDDSNPSRLPMVAKLLFYSSLLPIGLIVLNEFVPLGIFSSETDWFWYGLLTSVVLSTIGGVVAGVHHAMTRNRDGQSVNGMTTGQTALIILILAVSAFGILNHMSDGKGHIEVTPQSDRMTLGTHPLTIVDTSGEKPFGGTHRTHQDDATGITTRSFESANGRYKITLVDKVLTVNGEKYTLENPTDAIRIVDDRVEITRVMVGPQNGQPTDRDNAKVSSAFPTLQIMRVEEESTNLGSDVKRTWKLQGRGLDMVFAQILHISNGERRTTYQTKLELNDAGHGDRQGQLVLHSQDRPNDQVALSLDLSFGNDHGESKSEPVSFAKGLGLSSISSQSLWDAQHIDQDDLAFLLTRAQYPSDEKGSTMHRMDDLGAMVRASKQGAEFLVVILHWEAVSWKPKGTTINGEVTERILDRMKKAYAECKSYRDSGVIKSVFHKNTASPEFTVEHSFTTAFERPDRFRFEIKDQDDDKLLISADGEDVQTSWDIEPGNQTLESLELAMAQAMGFTGGDVGRIPAMLMPKKLDGWLDLDLIDPRQIEGGSLQNAECFRLEYNFRDEQFTLWIDKQSYLVRRIDERIKADGIRIDRTTHFDPTIDGKITDQMLEFDPPAPRAADDGVNMLPGSALGGNDSPTHTAQEQDADAANRKAGQQRSDNQLEMPLCWCPAGEFKMGRKQLPVTLTRGFWMGKYEVTQAQYKVLMGENPSENKGESLPVEKVEWTDAKKFCQKFTELERKAGRLPKGWEYRLPTEAQWEYACRAGTTLIWDEKDLVYPSAFGDDLSELGDYAWYSENCDGTPQPSGQKKPNAWGLCDMYGNVSEWVRDAWQSKLTGGKDPEVDVSFPIRTRRGGNWLSYAEPCGSPFIRGFVVGGREVPHMMGFRVALVSVGGAGDSAAMGGDLKLLQGDWNVVSFKLGGEEKLTGNKNVDSVLLEIIGQTFAMIDTQSNDERLVIKSGLIEIDATKNPKTIEFVDAISPSDRLVGIYELRDSILRICAVEQSSTVDDRREQFPEKHPKKKRPKTFDSPADSNITLMECRRTANNDLQTVSQLMRQARQPDPGSQLAINELLRHEVEGLLDSDQVNELIEVILKVQADWELPWQTEMGDLIEKRWHAGTLDRDIWEKYTAQFLVDICELKVRPRIAIGSPSGVLVQRNFRDLRCGSGKYIEFLLRETNGVTRVGSTIVGRVDVARSVIGHDSETSSANSSALTKQQWEPIKPGKQKITFDVELAILESVGPEASEGLDVFASRKATFKTEATFLPAGQSTVKLNVDPAMKHEVERAITLKRVETGPISQPTNSEQHFARVVLAVQPRPIDNIFTIVLRDGETEYDAGSYAHIIAAGDGNVHRINMAGIAGDLSGKRIDVILRPAPDEAERSIDLFEIWGEEIVFEDVLVQ